MEDSTPEDRSGRIIGVLATAGIVAALMQTIVVPFIGEMPRMLGTTASNASWVVTITLLVGGVFIPVIGRLGDLYGKQRMLLVCTVPLIAGSVVCALAESVVPMIVGRGLQGMGMGMIPLGISALRDLMPPRKLGSSIAFMSASLGVGGALGLPIAAAVTQQTSWRVLFWASAALSLMIAVLIWRLVPPTPPQTSGRVDVVGAIGLGIGLVCLLLGISKGADWGWGSGTVLGLLAAAVLVLLVWGRWELRSDDPLVDLRVAARRQVLLTNTASLLIGFSMYAQSLIIMQLLQLPQATGYGLGQSMLAAGLWMAPGGLMMMVVSPLGARLSAARGPRTTLFAGGLVIAFGYLSSMALLGSTWGMLVVTCIINGGVGLAYGAMPALIMGAVPLTETAAANGFNTLMRSIGTTASAAVTGAVLSQLTIEMGGHVLPSENGFRVGLLIASGAALLGSLITLALPRTRPEPLPDAPAEPTEQPVKTSA